MGPDLPQWSDARSSRVVGFCSISSDPAPYFASARLSCCASTLAKTAVFVVTLLVYPGVAFNFGGSSGRLRCDIAVREIEFHYFGFPLNARFARVSRVSIVARARAFVRLAVALHFQFLSFRFTCRTRHSRNRHDRACRGASQLEI